MNSPSLFDGPLATELQLSSLVANHRYLEALGRLIPFLYPETELRVEEHLAAVRLREELLEGLCAQMREVQDPPAQAIKFGTSGWRGILLDDFTLYTVGCVTRGLVEALENPALHAALGVGSTAELKSRGCVVAHDTRVMGPELAEQVARVLHAAGIKVIWLGMATTPEVSAAIAQTHAAFSINLTPSHNPYTYHGYKFNPSDGGPAPGTLTGPVSKAANQILAQGSGFKATDSVSWQAARQDPSQCQTEDAISLYKACLRDRLPWFDLPGLIERINAEGLDLFIDNGFGATTGKYEQLLDGVETDRLHLLNNTNDFLFGGKSREPSVENLRTIQDVMRQSTARFALAIMNDGDGDRFVGGGRSSALVMNKFGPMVVRHLSRAYGLRGDVTRSVMTSHMADAARALYQPDGVLHETAVGFQHMRPFVARSVNSWEESDGMSPQNWSLDKDGLLAALLLMDMVLQTRKTPEELLAETEAELGYFFFERRKVGGRLSGAELKDALERGFGALAPGSSLLIGGRAFQVSRLITLDGHKLVFDNGWWFGVRPSGTEPVVRPYVETFAPAGADARARDEARRWQQRILDWLEARIVDLIAT